MTDDTFVLHDHFSRHHHFDLRLERDGELASWAVPKGLPGTPGERRLAIEVEDLPLSNGTLKGRSRKGSTVRERCGSRMPARARRSNGRICGLKSCCTVGSFRTSAYFRKKLGKPAGSS